MKNLFILIALLICIAANAQQDWVQLNSGTTQELTCIFFVTPDSGFVSGNNGTILFTSNGGSNWVSRSISTTHYVRNIQFIDNNNGFGVYGENFIKTINAGINWVTTGHGSSLWVYDIYFPALTFGYACGEMGRIYRTTDSGNIWTFYSQMVFSNTLYSIFFTNDSTGFCTDGSSIFKSANGGLNWNWQFFGNANQCIYFPSDTIGYITAGGTIGKTSNAGVNWFDLIVPAVLQYSGIYFINNNTGYVTGSNGDSRKTTNGGTSWTVMTLPVSTFINSVFFVNSTTGYMCGYNGVILKTTNGGLTTAENNSTHFPNKYVLEQNFPNPFNPVTAINFDIPKNEYVTLKIFDILGKEVTTLVDEPLTPGKYEVKFDGRGLSSGVYFYQLNTSDFKDVKSMLLIK